MLTIFAIPKPFEGHVGLIQRNAIRSWLALDPQPEIILIGGEAGVEDIVREFGLRWLTDIERTGDGTPLLGDAFRKAVEQARFPVLCYVNCDIIFTRSLMDVAGKLTASRFLATGRRVNVDLTTEVAAAELADDSFVNGLAASGRLETPFAIDYFLFSRCADLERIPQFAVGRPGWDNWMIYHAISRRLPVINLTDGVLALHQNHGYAHVPRQRGNAWEGPEADYNRRLAGSPARLKYSMLDATHRYCPQRGVVPVPAGIGRGFKRLIADHPRLRWPLEILGYPWLQWERLRRRRLKKLGYPEPPPATTPSNGRRDGL